MRVKCPTCGREVEWSQQATYRPFCSERCRLIDLGAWFAGERAIADDAPGSQNDAIEGNPQREED